MEVQEEGCNLEPATVASRLFADTLEAMGAKSVETQKQAACLMLAKLNREVDM